MTGFRDFVDLDGVAFGLGGFMASKADVASAFRAPRRSAGLEREGERRKRGLLVAYLPCQRVVSLSNEG